MNTDDWSRQAKEAFEFVQSLAESNPYRSALGGGWECRFCDRAGLRQDDVIHHLGCIWRRARDLEDGVGLSPLSLRDWIGQAIKASWPDYVMTVDGELVERLLDAVGHWLGDQAPVIEKVLHAYGPSRRVLDEVDARVIANDVCIHLCGAVGPVALDQDADTERFERNEVTLLKEGKVWGGGR